MTTATQPLPPYPATRRPRCPLDPPAEYAAWRAAEGLQRARLGNGAEAWVVSRYEDIKMVLSDPRVSADARHYPELNPSAQEGMPHAFPRMDGPDHLRIRRMLTAEFSTGRVQKLRPRIEELASRCLDEMIEKGQPADLVHDYALPLPSLVISLLLGVPYEDHGRFQAHSETLSRADATRDERRTAVQSLGYYIYCLVERKKQEPGDDLISRLIAGRLESGELSQQDVALNGMILLHAGHETTAAMIGLSVLALLQDPEQAARLRDADDPAMTAKIVEELLRYLSIAQDAVVRVAAEDLDIGGQRVREGDLLTMNLPAANRDPDFLDEADKLDFDRDVRGHIAFGYGAHVCLGQTLARAELQIALPLLLRRLPDLQVAVPVENLRLRDNMSTFGVHELPVVW
ncbi:cytochrome P450 [Amycolatopsis japonica]